MQVALCLLIGLLILALPASANPTCVQDDTNQTVCVQQAQRVLVLAPHLTEIVDFVGGMSTVVAVDGSSNFPESVNTLPKLGNPWMLSAESILARKPDLVLVWQSGISMEVVAQLRKAGVPVFVSEPKKIEQVASTMRRVSKLLGTERASAPSATPASPFSRRARVLGDTPALTARSTTAMPRRSRAPRMSRPRRSRAGFDLGELIANHQI